MSRGEKREVPQPNGIYKTWVLLRPAEDLAGAWVAHSLEFDVVSQGNSAEHAMEMVAEAVNMVVQDDLNDGRDPYAQQRAQRAVDCLIAVQMFVMPKVMPTEDDIVRPSVRTPLAFRAQQEEACA